MEVLKFRAWNLLLKGWDYWSLEGLAVDKEIELHHYESWSEYKGNKNSLGKPIYESINEVKK